MKTIGIGLFLILFSGKLAALTCPLDNPGYFCITPEMSPQTPVQLFEFYNIPNKILSLFSKELKVKGYPLKLDAQWESPYFGAGMIFHENQFRMMILGGTTRVEEMTLDAYAATVCHELGHVLGGAPFQTIPNSQWASAEGQADFFAASICLPRYFSMSEKENTKKIVERVESAGFEMMMVMAKIETSQNIKFIRHKKDETKVSETLINNYPSLQCRYENFRNPSIRPACWFK